MFKNKVLSNNGRINWTFTEHRMSQLITIPTSRLRAFDILKFFAIFLVLWGHSIQYLTSGEFVDKPVYIFIYSFHMPLFMMISGYFASSSMQLAPLVFMKKKFIQLLLPCFSWTILLSALMSLKFCLKETDFCFWKVVSDGFLYNFWFLKSLFLCYIVAYFGKKLMPNMYLMALVTIILVQLVYWYNLPIMYPCFWVGMYLKSKDFQWQKNAVVLFVFFLVSFCFLLCFWDKSFWDYKVFNFTSILIEQEHYPLIYWYREAYRILIGIVGGLSFVFLFFLLFKREKKSKVFGICSEWGKYTLGIYILQSIILETLMAKFVNLDCFGFISFNFLVAPLISVCVLIASVFFVKLVRRWQIISFFFLGEYSRK